MSTRATEIMNSEINTEIIARVLRTKIRITTNRNFKRVFISDSAFISKDFNSNLFGLLGMFYLFITYNNIYYKLYKYCLSQFILF